MASNRSRLSLRARLFLASILLVTAALGFAAIGFERAARRVVVENVHSHLGARSVEIQNAVLRFQRERALTVRNWSEVDAMQLSLDSGDPKFAEDFLRRSIQDQGGGIAAVALLDASGKVVAAVRASTAHELRGTPLDGQRGRLLSTAPVQAARGGKSATAMGKLQDVDAGAPDGPAVVLAAPVKDFSGDIVGVVAASISPDGIRALLGDIGANDRTILPAVFDAERKLVLGTPTMETAPIRTVVEAPGTPGALEEQQTDGGVVLAVRTAPDADPPGWSGAMIVPERIAFGGLQTLRGALAALFVFVLVAAAAGGVWALGAAARPLTDVTRSMIKVALGDFSTRLQQQYSGELGDLVMSFNTMVTEVSRSRDELQRTEALRREVQIAHRIQTAILPGSPTVPGFEVAARMKPAADVGGDLYDLLVFPETFWVLIGDVSGHGINSGLVMMMAQAAAYATIADDPHATPCDVIAAVNRVVHENVRRRMGRDDYLTLMAARHLGDGRFIAAGAHQPIFIARSAGKVEVVEPVGPWCGVTPEMGEGLREFEFGLGRGDLLCLITDGVVEASQGDGGGLYGEDRLTELLGRVGACTAPQALASVFDEVEKFASVQTDDMTAVLLRRTDG